MELILKNDMELSKLLVFNIGELQEKGLYWNEF